jgi:hypothetical protein
VDEVELYKREYIQAGVHSARIASEKPDQQTIGPATDFLSYTHGPLIPLKMSIDRPRRKAGGNNRHPN